MSLECLEKTISASTFSWRKIIVSGIAFFQSPIYDRKDMVDAAMKPRHLSSTGKKLQDQLS